MSLRKRILRLGMKETNKKIKEKEKEKEKKKRRGWKMIQRVHSVWEGKCELIKRKTKRKNIKKRYKKGELKWIERNKSQGNYQWPPTRIQFLSKSFKTTAKLEIQNSKFKIQIQ